MVDQADKLRALMGEDGLEEDSNIKLEVVEGFYKGVYESTIKSVDKKYLVVSMPYKNGKLIPLNAGIYVNVEINHRGFVRKFSAEILERKIRPIPLLYISKPNKISRAGRMSTQGTKVLVITSGKGGVGKTNIAVNLAIAFTKQGKKTVIIDADLGLANVDVILGLTPKYNLSHLIQGQALIKDIIYEGPFGLKIIPAGSGIEHLVDINQWQLTRFINNLNELENSSDLIIIDTGAGLSKTVTSFVLAADEVLVVTTPEPTSITDAYALIKVTSRMQQKRYKIIINKAASYEEAQESIHKLKLTCKKFLNIDLEYLGYIPEDKCVSLSVKNQVPFIIKHPSSKASRGIYNIVSKLCNGTKDYEDRENLGIKGFFRKIISIVR